jgi:hypothetical protein
MDHQVRRIRASECRQYRELRLDALKDSPMAFGERYEESLARPDRFWQDGVQRSATAVVRLIRRPATPGFPSRRFASR